MEILTSIDENVHLCDYGPGPLVAGWTYEQLDWTPPKKAAKAQDSNCGTLSPSATLPLSF